MLHHFKGKRPSTARFILSHGIWNTFPDFCFGSEGREVLWYKQGKKKEQKKEKEREKERK